MEVYVIFKILILLIRILVYMVWDAFLLIDM